MDDSIHVGHPFFFPTQVVLVDDNPDFLDGVTLMLDKNLSFRKFHSATEALDYVNQGHRQVHFLERCYSNYKTGPSDSDSLSHINIARLHEEIFNRSRFQTCSTVIVDYSMPEMNGLEFLMELKNPFINKVLLTGQADTELAIKAFNKQLIDQYIDKHDSRLKQLLNQTISSFEDQYFRQSFKLITDPLIANNHDTFLTNAGFQKYFTELRAKTRCMEYYLIEMPHSGYLMVDRHGKKRILLVFTATEIQHHCNQLRIANAPESLWNSVLAGKLLPIFDIRNQDETIDARFIENREKYYQPAVRIEGSKHYYVTSLSDDSLPESYQGDILPFADFLESNSIDSEILH